jgi:hypothetical protein
MSSLKQLWKSMFGLRARRAGIALTLGIVCGLTLATIQAAQAQTFQVIHIFTGGRDGAIPGATLTDRAGTLYGTTYAGGTGFGTAYQLKGSGSGWVVNPLYTFAGGNDGANPNCERGRRPKRPPVWYDLCRRR